MRTIIPGQARDARWDYRNPPGGAQITKTQALVDAAQEVFGWDVIFQVERVKQALHTR